MTDVLIADESPVLREGLAAVLRAEGMAVVGTVPTAGALHLRLEIDQPDVALVGIPMPPAGRDNAVCAIEQMRLQHRGVGVVVLSSCFDPGTAGGWSAAGRRARPTCSRSPSPTSRRSCVRCGSWRAGGLTSTGP